MAKAETKKINVCFVCPKAYPLFNPDVQAVFGGAEVDVYMIATELAKDESFNVWCIVANYGQPQTETRENVQLLKSLDFNENSLAGASKIWTALKQADAAVYVLKTASRGVPLVREFCTKNQRRFVYRTAHEDECNGRYVKKHPVLGRLFVRSLKRADMIFAQNQSDAKSLRELYGIEAVVIPNAHHIPETSEGERKWILWVGRSADFKHPQCFLTLAQAFPDESFVMICQRATGDSHYDVLRSQAEEIGNLRFLTRVDFHEIDTYFQQAKVFVNTSDSEGFANTFIQACKAETAILSYAVNPDGFLDTHQCGVACGGNEEILRQQLKELLMNDRYLEFGINGKRYVKERHDITRLIKHYKSCFRQWENQ